MKIGIPKETKTLEGRVALVPAAAADLVRADHDLWDVHSKHREARAVAERFGAQVIQQDVALAG